MSDSFEAQSLVQWRARALRLVWEVRSVTERVRATSTDQLSEPRNCIAGENNRQHVAFSWTDEYFTWQAAEIGIGELNMFRGSPMSAEVRSRAQPWADLRSN